MNEETAVEEIAQECSLYMAVDNTVCNKPKGHDNGIHEPSVMCKPTSRQNNINREQAQ